MLREIEREIERHREIEAEMERLQLRQKTDVKIDAGATAGGAGAAEEAAAAQELLSGYWDTWHPLLDTLYSLCAESKDGLRLSLPTLFAALQARGVRHNVLPHLLCACYHRWEKPPQRHQLQQQPSAAQLHEQVLHDSRRILVCAFDLFVPPSDTSPSLCPSPSPSPSAAALPRDGTISHHLLRDGAVGCLRYKQMMRLAQVPGGGGGEARGLSLTAGLPAAATAFAAAFDLTHLAPAFKWIARQATNNMAARSLGSPGAGGGRGAWRRDLAS